MKQNTSSTNLRAVTQLKYHFNSILSQRTDFFLFRARRNYFKSGERAGRLLAWQIKNGESSSTIPAVRPQRGGSLLTKSVDINYTFRDFYRNLYTSGASVSRGVTNYFLDSLGLPRLKQNKREALDAPIMDREMAEIIQSLPSGKSQSPDGFYQFFKCYTTEFILRLQGMYSEAFENPELPPTLRQAIISLILKNNKEPCDK